MKVFNNPHFHSQKLSSSNNSLQSSRVGQQISKSQDGQFTHSRSQEMESHIEFNEMMTKLKALQIEEENKGQMDLYEEMSKLKSRVLNLLKRYQVLLQGEQAKQTRNQIKTDVDEILQEYELIVERYQIDETPLEIENNIPSIQREKEINNMFNLVEEFLEKFSHRRPTMNYFSILQQEKMQRNGLGQFHIEQQDQNRQSAYDFQEQVQDLSNSKHSSEQELQQSKMALSNSQQLRNQIRRRFFDLAQKIKEELPLYHEGRKTLTSILFEDAEEEGVDEKDWDQWLRKNLKVSFHRYSELKGFHESLQKYISALKLQIQLPEFPGRKLFGSTNKNQQAILARQMELTTYFAELLSMDKIINLPPFSQFLPVEIVKQTQSIKVIIEKYTVYDDVVMYYLRFKDKQNKTEWCAKQRYSELKNLHEVLINQGYKQLPPFPARKIFGITNDNPENIEKRREDLENYLNGIFNTREIYDSDAIQFLIADTRREYEKQKQNEDSKLNQQQEIRGDLNEKVFQIFEDSENMIRQDNQ